LGKKKTNSLLVFRGVWLSIIGSQDFSSASYVLLRRKAIDGQGQGFNIGGETMQAEIYLPSNKLKTSLVLPSVENVGVISV
jgi:hypothetical protein